MIFIVKDDHNEARDMVNENVQSSLLLINQYLFSLLLDMF
jgi:hypothetical protein